MWLLQASIILAFERVHSGNYHPSAEQQLEYEARFSTSDSSADTPRLLTIAGNQAEIAIQGVITNKPNFMAFLFGGGNTTYSDILSALTAAENDPAVESITLAIDSPGGTVAGLFDTLDAINATTKPVKAVVSNVAASAAFAIATQADSIVAGNRATSFGSVGVVAHGFIEEGEFAITSTDAPKKAPDMKTAEGQAMVREELDAIHVLFVDAISSGRDTTAENVNTNFGQGATLLADEALKRGMIDGIGANALSVVPKSDTNQNAQAGKLETEAGKMNLAELMAQHPELVTEIQTAATGKERDRVSAHLTAGQASGEMKTAVAACLEGTEMTLTIQTAYVMAAANQANTNDRQSESDEVDGADGANLEDDDSRDKAASAKLLQMTAALMGMEITA